MLPINLHEVKDGHRVSGLLLISSYTKKLDPTSRAPLYGQATFQGKTVGFKIWDAVLQNVFNTQNLEGVIIAVNADAGVYKNNLELTLKDIQFDHGFTDKHAFYKSIDIEPVFQNFGQFINSNLSPKAVIVVATLFQEQGLYEPFKTTWAGAKMHDAQVGGLMNHTLKMLRLAKTLIENDSRLAQWSDLIFLSIILHDIGKIHEIGEGGVYTDISFAGHRTFGIEIVAKHKTLFVENFDEKFYYHILEVISGHHGEYGDPPKTIWAYIVHLIDMLESQVTGFLDKVTNNELNEKNGNKVVWSNGTNLYV